MFCNFEIALRFDSILFITNNQKNQDLPMAYQASQSTLSQLQDTFGCRTIASHFNQQSQLPQRLREYPLMTQEQRQSYLTRPLGFRITPSSQSGSRNVCHSMNLYKQQEKKDESLQRFVTAQNQAHLLLHLKRNLEQQRKNIVPARFTQNETSKKSQESLRSPNSETAVDENTYRLRLQSKLEEIQSNHSQKNNLTIKGSPQQSRAVDTFALAKQQRILETYGLNMKQTPTSHRMKLSKNHSQEGIIKRLHDFTSRINLLKFPSQADVGKSQNSMMFKDDPASCQTLRQVTTCSIGTNSSEMLLLQDSKRVLKKNIEVQMTRKFLTSAGARPSNRATEVVSKLMSSRNQLWPGNNCKYLSSQSQSRKVSKERSLQPKISCSIKILKSSNNQARLYSSKSKEGKRVESSNKGQTLILKDVQNPIDVSSNSQEQFISVQPPNFDCIDQTQQTNQELVMQKTNPSWCSSSFLEFPMKQQYTNINEEVKRNRFNSDSKETTLQPVKYHHEDPPLDDCDYMSYSNLIQKNDTKSSSDSNLSTKTKKTLSMKSQLIQLDITSHATKHAIHSKVVPPTAIQNQKLPSGARFSRNTQIKLATAQFCQRHMPEYSNSFPKQTQLQRNSVLKQSNHLLSTSSELKNPVILQPVKVPDICTTDDEQAENYKDSILEAGSQQTIDRVSTLQMQELMRLRSGGLNLFNSQQSLFDSSQSQYQIPFHAPKESFKLSNEDEELIDAYLMNRQPIFNEEQNLILNSEEKTRVDTYSSLHNNTISFKPAPDVTRKKGTRLGRNLPIPALKGNPNGRKRNTNLLSTLNMERSDEQEDSIKVKHLVKILNSKSTKQLNNYDEQKWLKTFCSSDRQSKNIANNHVFPKKEKQKNRANDSPNKHLSRDSSKKIKIGQGSEKAQVISIDEKKAFLNMDLHKVSSSQIQTQKKRSQTKEVFIA